MVTGGGPWSITFDSYNNNLYVANGGSNTVSTHTDPYGVCIFSNKATTEIVLPPDAPNTSKDSLTCNEASFNE
jgi:DNA-binding beta-propeller fold protein YncE